MKIYTVFDKVAERVVCAFSANNDGLAVRDNAPALSKAIPLGDCELRCINEDFNDSMTDVKYRVVSWESWKIPENPFKQSDNNLTSNS